ncbi:MAG: hypothetical protein ACUVWJ_01660 [Spirochaetota bacterium]
MEIKGTFVTEKKNFQSSSDLREGSLTRVKVIRFVHDRLSVVELKGKTHLARIEPSLKSRLFIARVNKTAPHIELKFIKSLDRVDSRIKGFITRLFSEKKQFIQKIITTDNLAEIPCINIIGNKKSIKRSLRQVIIKQSNYRTFIHNREIAGYFILQNIYNLLNSQSCFFVLPLRFEHRKLYSELQVSGAEEVGGYSFVLRIHADNEKKIVFFVYIDCREINCLISTNDKDLEDKLKRNSGRLLCTLKSIWYTREVILRLVPYDEGSAPEQSLFKRVDIMM